ncbi:multiprotein-bridging factor 1 [Savitreella phatthalungensis]
MAFQPSNTGWDDVVKIGKSTGSRTGVARTTGAVNAAARAGGIVGTEKKYGGANTQHSSTEGQLLTKIDRENEVAPPKKVDAEVGKVMSQARLAKGLKQSDLAQKINEKPQVINDYESGKAVPNQQILAKIERQLGVKLRGKDIGADLGGPKKK